jgi:hypothetical protein
MLTFCSKETETKKLQISLKKVLTNRARGGIIYRHSQRGVFKRGPEESEKAADFEN